MSGWSPNARILAGFAAGAAGGVLANVVWKGAPELDWVVRNLADYHVPSCADTPRLESLASVVSRRNWLASATW